jgi:hypothetical protein
MIRFLVVFISILTFTSCEKNYVCVCHSVNSKQDTMVDQIKTTKLGSKGYYKTCSGKENTSLNNCRVK